MSEPKHHWNAIYQKSPVDALGWYESIPQPSLELIHECGLPKDARMLHAGAGASTLIDALLKEGFEGLIACDISPEALQKAKIRLGDAAARVTWIVDDLTNPALLQDLAPVDLWHDRAVLHFFTEEHDRQTYFNLLRKLVKPGGFVIIAAFNLQGAHKCSGLPVKNYDASIIAQHLGPEFRLLKEFNYLYYMPSGEERPYVYTLFQRKE